MGNDKKTPNDEASTAVADQANRMDDDAEFDEASGTGESDAPYAAPRSLGYAEKAAAKRGSFFLVFKPGQGYYTRLGTGVFFGVLVLWCAAFVYSKMLGYFVDKAGWEQYVLYGVPVVSLVVLGLLLYWITCVNRRAVDFFIATEGEMKKVSWSTRREVVGSTKVVVGTVIILSVILFVVDLVFMLLLTWIGVLRMPPGTIRHLFGMT